jgi:hypothetical protein
MPTTTLERPKPAQHIDEGPLRFDITTPNGYVIASLASQEALSIALATPAFGMPHVKLRAGYHIEIHPRRKRSYPSPPLKKAADDLHALVRSRKVRT